MIDNNFKRKEKPVYRSTWFSFGEEGLEKGCALGLTSWLQANAGRLTETTAEA